MDKKVIAKILAGAAFALSPALLSAQDYVAVNRAAKVFDTPNAKGYVTLNTKNAEVTTMPGMVFKSVENNNGWYLVEYSPGLRGYISAQSMCVPAKLPAVGSYKVANAPAESVKIEKNGENWTASANGASFPGKAFGNIVVFFNADNNPVYSAVDLGQGVAVMSYDNSVTNFF